MAAAELYLEFFLELFIKFSSHLFFGFWLFDCLLLNLLLFIWCQQLVDLFLKCELYLFNQLESCQLLFMVPLAVGVRFELVKVELLEVSTRVPLELVIISKYLI